MTQEDKKHPLDVFINNLKMHPAITEHSKMPSPSNEWYFELYFNLNQKTLHWRYLKQAFQAALKEESNDA